MTQRVMETHLLGDFAATFAMRGGVHLHLWRTHYKHEDAKALHLPVHVNKGGREVFSFRPGEVRGFKSSSPWTEWVKTEEAVQAIAEGDVCSGGFRVDRWLTVIK